MGEELAAEASLANIDGEKGVEVGGPWNRVDGEGADCLLGSSRCCWEEPASSGAFFLFFRAWDSFSDLSRTTLAIRSNSPQSESIRLMLPFD